MTKLTILDNDYATLWYYPETKILHHKIKKFIFGKPLQDLLSEGTKQLKKYRAQKWLSDDRNNNALTVSDAEWTSTVWLPTTAKGGWKYWAIVEPEKITGQMNMKKHASITNHAGVIVNVFHDPNEAMAWLENQ